MKLEDIDIQTLDNALCMDNHRNTPVAQATN